MAETPRMKIADLDDERPSKVQALEQDIGVCVVALEHRMAFTDLSPEQLEKLQAAEEELGVVLMAYECAWYFESAVAYPILWRPSTRYSCP